MDVMTTKLKAPFPYFGGKSKVAGLVWSRLGNVRNYVEPFFGSGAVLLARPDEHEWWGRTETVNDKDGMVANFWRAVQAEPEAVAKYADWPVNENDLHARHAWLVEQKEDLVERLEGDPDFYDAKIAGWWVWGACAWIGGGWCSGNGPWVRKDGRLVRVSGAGGVRKTRPHLGNDGRGVHKQRPHLAHSGMGVHGKMVSDVYQWMELLANRLRRVRVACGDWKRVCGPAVLFPVGKPIGVFLDPPYTKSERTVGCYNTDLTDPDCAAEAREWAIEVGKDPRVRIAFCGYEGEHEFPEDWECVPWKANGGHGNRSDGRGRENAKRERIWFSPHCLKPTELFEG